VIQLDAVTMLRRDVERVYIGAALALSGGVKWPALQ
jgi:hypothetical protein